MQICIVNQNYGALILFEHSKHFLELVCPGTQFGECYGLIILPFKKLQDQITCYWRKYYKSGWGNSNIQWISALGQICLAWFKFYFSKEHLHCIYCLSTGLWNKNSIPQLQSMQRLYNYLPGGQDPGERYEIHTEFSLGLIFTSDIWKSIQKASYIFCPIVSLKLSSFIY